MSTPAYTSNFTQECPVCEKIHTMLNLFRLCPDHLAQRCSGFVFLVAIDDADDTKGKYLDNTKKLGTYCVLKEETFAPFFKFDVPDHGVICCSIDTINLLESNDADETSLPT